MSKSWSIIFLILCLSQIGSANLEFTVLKAGELFPYSANYLHSFKDNSLRTRTVSEIIQFYAVFEPSKNVDHDSPVSILFNEKTCAGDPTYMVVQFGKCVWKLQSSISPKGVCEINELESDLAPKSTPTPTNSTNFSKHLKYNGCSPSSITMDDLTKRVNVKIQINKDKSGVELVLEDASYGYPSQPNSLVIFVILCGLFVLTIIVVVASILFVYFSHLFFKTKSVQ